jgi:predicted negative regulator of RcsB-dependent stress response
LIVLVLAAALTTLPLVGSLGYEHGFVLAPLFSLVAMAVGVDAMRSVGGTDEASWWAVGGAVLRELALLHGIAVGMTLVGGLWQRGCDPWGGLAFYAMAPGLSSLLGAACGVIAATFVERRRRALLLAFVPMASCIAIGLWRLYADPVVYAYDPFFGYFSGSVYDEGVAVTDRYLRYRGYTVLAGFAALSVLAVVTDGSLRCRRNPLEGLAGRRMVLAAVALGSSTASLLIGWNGASLGFTADEESIREVLSQRIETEHFIIDYAPRTPDDRTIELIAAEHEFAFARLKEKMGGRAPEGKVHSFVFRDRAQKRAAMGAGTVQVAAPWRQQIYLDHRDFPHPVMHHELAHIFGNTVGDDLFGVARDGLRLNVGLIEGFATGLAPRPSDRLDLHDQVEVLIALKRRPPLAAIMGPGFLSQSSRVAYTTAGSFVLWLIETRGFEPMATFYRTAGDAQASYGQSLESLEAEWLAFLGERNGIRPEDVEAQAQRFKRGSVFERPCAHIVAEIRAELGRATGRAKFDEAVDLHQELCALEPKQPIHRLGLARGQMEARNIDGALETLRALEAMPDLTVSVLSRMHELRGDVHLYEGTLDQARAAYDAGLALPDDEGHTRMLQLKRTATEDPALAEVLIDYLSLFDIEGDGFTQGIARLAGAHRIRALSAHEALGSYLVARQLLNVQRPAAAIEFLEQALSQADALPSDEFRRATRYELMSAYTQTRAYDKAAALLESLTSEPGIGNGHRLRYGEWRDRIAFFRQYRPQ